MTVFDIILAADCANVCNLCTQASPPVELKGFPHRIDGVYEPSTLPLRQDCVVYYQRGETDGKWLCMTRTGWMVKAKNDMLANTITQCSLRCVGRFAEAPSPLDVPFENWRIHLPKSGDDQLPGLGARIAAEGVLCAAHNPLLHSGGEDRDLCG